MWRGRSISQKVSTVNRPQNLAPPTRLPWPVVAFSASVVAVVLGLLVVDALNYLTETIELGAGSARWLAFDDGRLATLLMAALSAGVALAALRVAGGKSDNIEVLPRRAVWVAFGLGCLVIGALDVADVELSTGEADLSGAVLLLVGAVIAWRLRVRRLAFWLMVAGLVLIVVSPALGIIENDLLTNPDNYVAVASGQPYPFHHSAWVELWWVSRGQELAELGAMACFLLALDGVPAKRERAD